MTTVGSRVRRRFDVVFSWPTRALIVIGALVSVLGLIAETGDSDGRLWWPGVLLLGGAFIPVGWAALETLWRPDPDIANPMAALNRTLLVPLIAGPVVAVVDAVVVALPPVEAVISAAREPSGWHYYFPQDGGSPVFQVLVWGGLVGTALSMLFGLLLSIVVVVPTTAFRRPAEFARANMLDTSTAAAAADNRAAGRFFSILVILVFAVPTLLIVGSKNADAPSLRELTGTWWRAFSDPGTYWGDGLWALGLLLIPLGIAALIVVIVRQRPDVARRRSAAAGAIIERDPDDRPID